jgi:hypothetical protein
VTTEVAVREDQTSAIAVRETAVLATLADWAAEARAAAAIAKSLCETSFVPKHFRGNPAEATAAILTGHELGLSPMASLRSIYVIGGTPAMYAIALRAVVQSKGHQIWVDEASATRVVVCGRRKGSDRIETSEWTAERAKTAELLSNAQYKKNPRNMLTARATVEVCRLIAADAIHGIPYAVEELDGEPSFSPAPTATRVTAAEILGEPTPAAEPDEPEPDHGMMSMPQQRKMFALLKERGYADRDAALAFIAVTIGHEIESRNELTRDEARRVIDKLDAMDPEPPSDGVE